MSYQVYLINLARSPKRLARMEAHLTDVGLSWQRVEAIDGQVLPNLYWQKVDQACYLRMHGKQVTPDEVGCYFSHLKAIEAFLTSDHEHALIFEDDVIIDPHFKLLWEHLLQQHALWDFLHLSGVHRAAPMSLHAIDGEYELAVYLARQTGAGAYAINRLAAKKLLAHLLPMKVPFDHAFNKPWELGLRQWGVHPLPVDQKTLELTQSSTIDQALIKAGRLPWWRKLPTMRFRLQCEARRLIYGLLQWLKWRMFGSCGQRRESL